jgi:uncharacterized membrane protein
MNDRPRATEANRCQDLESCMDVLVGYVLLVGVMTSAALVVAGLAWHWIRTGQLEVHYTLAKMNLFQFVVADVSNVVEGAFRPRLLISLGVAVLLLTPYVRVLASLLFFLFVEHNGKYSLFTAFVLLVLTYSLFLR